MQHVSGLRIECSFVAGTLKPLVTAIKIDGTGKMRALLPECVVTAIE